MPDTDPQILQRNDRHGDQQHPQDLLQAARLKAPGGLIGLRHSLLCDTHRSPAAKTDA